MLRVAAEPAPGHFPGGEEALDGGNDQGLDFGGCGFGNREPVCGLACVREIPAHGRQNRLDALGIGVGQPRLGDVAGEALVLRLEGVEDAGVDEGVTIRARGKCRVGGGKGRRIADVAEIGLVSVEELERLEVRDDVPAVEVQRGRRQARR